MTSAKIWPKMPPPPPPPPCISRYRTHTLYRMHYNRQVQMYMVLILILDEHENHRLLKNSTILKKYLNCQIIY